MLDKTNFVRFLIVPKVVHVTGDRFEECSVRRCGISMPMTVAALFDDEILWGFEMIISDGGRKVACREHGAAERVPFGRSLIVIGLLEELSYPGVY